jgi:hypothetical protein
MFSRRLKTGYFILEGLNCFATVYYFYYFYFFMQTVYGFGNKANLALAALNGAVYAVMAWQGGNFAQRFGYFTALKAGFLIMMVTLAIGSQLHTAGGHILVMAVAVAGMCFTWPTLEALVSEGETRAGVQRMVGVYNMTWAGTGAVAYFFGGAMLEKLGPASLFYIPVAIQVTQFSLTLWLESQARRAAPASVTHPAPATPEVHPHPAATTRLFLRMAWLSNPFAYIAINTLIAVIPGVAKRLELSTMIAGFCCSLWCFSRLGAFFVLWHRSSSAASPDSSTTPRSFTRWTSATPKASTAASTRRLSALATSPARPWARPRSISSRNTPTAEFWPSAACCSSAWAVCSPSGGSVRGSP